MPLAGGHADFLFGVGDVQGVDEPADEQTVILNHLHEGIWAGLAVVSLDERWLLTLLTLPFVCLIDAADQRRRTSSSPAVGIKRLATSSQTARPGALKPLGGLGSSGIRSVYVLMTV